MRFTFRTKLLIIFFVTMSAFLVLVVSAKFLNDKMQNQLTEIRDRYVPLLNLEPMVMNTYEDLGRAFQDAVAAQDPGLLEEAREVKNHLLEQLRDAEKLVNSDNLAQLLSAVEKYFESAYELSERMMTDETGFPIMQKMMNMQSLQGQGETLLRKTFSFDRHRIHAAFADITRLQEFHARIRIFTGISALFVVVIVSVWLSRGLLRSLKELSTGLDRFAEGDFNEPIRVVSDDEISDVAREANHMAVQIKSLMKELESFSYSVAHDLRAPLRSILAYSNILLEDFADKIPEDAKDPLLRISRAAKKMGDLIDSLLAFSRLTRKEMNRQTLDLSMIVENILDELKKEHPERDVELKIEGGIEAKGDPQLLQIVLANLIGNAWKYTSKKEHADIEFGAIRRDKEKVYFVKDNGVGFDMKFYNKLFATFQRLHNADEFEGTGIGLAMVQNIVHRHGGRIWAEAEPDKGATFYFTLA